ncbi:MAG: bifunctional folylpolyglutamate synthase/dihydrofolate synthase [Lachnospiraceae bacterium]|nr:bifunctional folylpolyglutamate synthase/dihydrofolate synthase [Lachnospiraceae bacterium]
MIRQEIKTYEEAVEYLLNIPRFTKKNSMEDTKAFLGRLGNPDRDLKILHVAGTNGKGSVCAYLRYMLEEAGYAVCSFTSPHLVDVRERFLICGEMVGKEDFLKAFLAIYDLIPWEILAKEDVFNEEGKLPEGFYHPTFFEYLFFMAMLLFREAKPDYCILETGLGGRLDATNSVGKKELSIITRISLDHMEYLGDTVEKIAGEKAGIIAAGTPVIYLDDEKNVSAVFDERAKKLGAKACPTSKNDYALIKFQNKNIDFSLRTRYYKDISVTLHTAALYQMENAALAVRALEELDKGRTLRAEHVTAGLAKCFWPGRMEEIAKDVFVDGAHNEDGVRAFLESVRADGWQGERILLFSAVKDKQFEKMLGKIISSRLFTKVFLTHVDSGRATKTEVLEEVTARLLKESYAGEEEKRLETGTYENVLQALGDLLEKKQAHQRIYIAGSLYLVGEVKASLGVLKNDQFRRRTEEVPSEH